MARAKEAFDLGMADAEVLLARLNAKDAKLTQEQGEVHKRATLLLACAAWETYVEERVNESLTAKIDAAPIIPDAPNAAGLSLREDWKFAIVDAASIPREYLVPDEVKIGRIVRVLKGEAKIPGVRIWSEKSVSSRVM